MNGDELEITPSRLIATCLENRNSGSYLIYRFGSDFKRLNEDEKIEFILILNQNESIREKYLVPLKILIMTEDLEFYEKYKIIID